MTSTVVPTYLEQILSSDGEQRFIVAERLPRGNLTDEEVSECVREAEAASSLEHANVVHTRAIVVRRDEISVMSDYVAGERLSDLWSPTSDPARKLPLEIALTILIDALTGLGALHKLRGAEGRLKFVHGEVTAENVLVGLDGVSALLRACRVRRPSSSPARGRATSAPEVVSGAAPDQRADIYSIGALLWQALSGRPLFPDDDVEAILASAKSGSVARAVVPRGEPWALPLADVAARALSPVAERRFPTASSMVTELRRIAGPKLASTARVAEFVEAAAGHKIAARLADVQASAVIRKATSIPAPHTSSPDGPGGSAVRLESAEPSLIEVEDSDLEPPNDGVPTLLASLATAATVRLELPPGFSPGTDLGRAYPFPEPPSSITSKVPGSSGRAAGVADPARTVRARAPSSFRLPRIAAAIIGVVALIVLAAYLVRRHSRATTVAPAAAAPIADPLAAPVPTAAPAPSSMDVVSAGAAVPEPVRPAEKAPAASSSASTSPKKRSLPRKLSAPKPRRK